TGQAKGGAQIQAGPLRAIAFGGASRRVALVGDVLRLRQPDGTFLTLVGHQEGVLCVALARDGARVASGGNGCPVRVWRASDGQELACLTGHTGPVRAVAFSPDSRYVYSGAADGELRRWPVPW